MTTHMDAQNTGWVMETIHPIMFSGVAAWEPHGIHIGAVGKPCPVEAALWEPTKKLFEGKIRSQEPCERFGK